MMMLLLLLFLIFLGAAGINGLRLWLCSNGRGRGSYRHRDSRI